MARELIFKQYRYFLIYSCLFFISSTALATTNIPSQAWSRDINAGGYLDGAPSGGFGAGSYTWNFAGDFYLSRLNIATSPAAWTNNDPYTLDSNCHFYMYQKPSGQTAATNLLNATTLGSGQANYYSLYPKSWVDYYGSKFSCKARVTQFTPMIPGDDNRSSYPEGIYEWDLSNPTCTSTDVAIMVTWDNTFGGASASVTTSGNNTGIVLTRTGGSATSKSQGEFTLAAQSSAGVSITYESAATVATLQTAFNTAGLLSNTVGSNTIGGIAFKVTLAPGQSVKIPITIAWDIPLCQPGTGAQWYREYTRTYGRTGLNSFSIANDALNNYATWESSIDTWQGGVLGGPYPDWFKQMLFNELYYYVIGGTIWEAGQYGNTSYDAGPDMFSSLESYIYAFYGTSDVRFYGSWALAQMWPNIDKQEVEQFSDSVVVSPSQTLPRPAAIGTCAHDFGSLNDVFTAWNDYTYRDSTTWKDLNSKLVLMVYRDWELTGSSDTAFLNYCWPSVQTAMTKVHSQCVSGGVTYNLPISTGVDQTYDNLGLTGETSYCGSLYLAACEAGKAIATAEGNAALANTYQSWLTLGQADFETNLWDSMGNYYNIDTGSGAGGVTGVARIMSDQLCGQWYAKACGLADVVPASHAVSAWQAVFNNNYSKFDTGTHGVVNVMTSAGAIDTSTSQTQEAWVGTTWGAVAGMIQEGMFTQGVSIGNSLYNCVWNLGQMWFRTPEAWTTGLANIRAPYYMRANCIWAAKHAYDVNSPCGAVACTPIPSPTPLTTPTVNCGTSPTMTFSPTPSGTPTPTRTFTQSPTPTHSSTWTATRSNTPTPTATFTFSSTLTFTPTPPFTLTPTRTATVISTLTPTLTATPIPTGTPTPTFSVTSTFTSTRTNTPQNTATFTLTASLTNSVTPTLTQTSTKTYTLTSSPTLTGTVTVSPTPSTVLTNTHTPVITPTLTLTATSTLSQTVTSTFTLTPSPVFSTTSTPTLTRTNTPGVTLTNTPFSTATSTNTYTDSPTSTFSRTQTPNSTPTSTGSATPTTTASLTNSFTWTPTVLLSSTQTPTPVNSTTATLQPTLTLTPTLTAYPVPSSTPSATYTSTPSASFTSTQTLTLTVTSTPTLTPTVINTVTWSPTPHSTITDTPVNTPYFTFSPSPTPTPSGSPTPGFTSTRTTTPTFSPTPTSTIGFTNTATATETNSNTPSFTPTPTFSATDTRTTTPTATQTPTPTWTMTRSLTPTPSPTISPTATLTPVDTPVPSLTPFPTLTPQASVWVSAPFPNPSNGGKPIIVDVYDPDQGSAEWSVFTTGFRKIRWGTVALNGYGYLSWDGLDQFGNQASSGLYYLKVTFSGGGSQKFIRKILLLR